MRVKGRVPMKCRIFALLFCLAALLTVSVGAVEYAGFPDVDGNADYADAIQWAAEQGYINGYPDGRFGVNDPVTRAQLAAIFCRAAGSPAASGMSRFSDVQATAYYATAAIWAENSGLISGYPDGRFGVNDPVTRQQVVTILWRWAGSPDASGEDYADETSIATYAQTAVDWSQSNHILAGRENGFFAPNDSATRAEVVSALYQYRTKLDSDGQENQESSESEGNAMPQLTIEAGGQVFTATLEDNPSTRALLKHLPMTISMGELNGNEKYYYMPDSLPTDSHRPGNIRAGDLMLYGSDCLVLFYESFSSGYSYTRLGSIDDPSDLAAALGHGTVDVTFQVN